MLAQTWRFLDCTERSERSDFDDSAGLRPDSSQLCKAAQIEHVLRFKKFLPHRRNQVSAASKHTDITCVFREAGNGFVNATRPEQPKLWKAQSAPPAGAEASRRAGSSACRSGPLPLKQSDPPCSRKRWGEVGSTPSVRFNALSFLFARSAANTRSGVN